MTLTTKRCSHAVLSIGIALCAVLGGVPQAWADYRVELDGSYAEGDDPFGDIDNITFSVEAFLNPVDDSAGPYSEAAFLTRASSLRYGFDRTDRDLDFGDGIALTNEEAIKNHTLSARYVAVDSGWIATGLIAIPEDRQDQDTTTDGFRIGAGIGRYVSTNTTLEVNLEYARQDTNSESALECDPFLLILAPSCDMTILESGSQADVFGVNVGFRHVGSLAGQTFATSVSGGYSNSSFDLDASQTIVDADGQEAPVLLDGVDNFGDFETPSVPSIDSWNFVAAGTWYVNRQLGIDAAYTFEKADDLDVHGVSAGFGWFVSPHIELRGAYTFAFPDLGSNNDLWRVTLRGRF